MTGPAWELHLRPGGRNTSRLPLWLVLGAAALLQSSMCRLLTQATSDEHLLGAALSPAPLSCPPHTALSAVVPLYL